MRSFSYRLDARKLLCEQIRSQENIHSCLLSEHIGTGCRDCYIREFGIESGRDSDADTLDNGVLWALDRVLNVLYRNISNVPSSVQVSGDEMVKHRI